MEQLTYCRITESGNNIVIPEEALQDIGRLVGDGKLLSIYSSNAKALYFFKVTSEVYHIRIKIYPLTPEIVAKIMGKIAQVAARIVYSTGLCLVGDKCYWEGFIQKDELMKDISEVKDFLMEVEEVEDVEILLIS